MNPYATNLIEAARGVHAALDNIESTQDIRGLLDAINQAGDRINEMTDATIQIMSYLESLILAAKRELDLGGA
jgi:hypothetical protein